MNHLEGMISEWLENTGYIVARNHKVGRRVKGGWGGELDVIAYNPATKHLVHYEPSVDATSWARREDSRLIYQVFINQSLTVFVQLHCAHKRW